MGRCNLLGITYKFNPEEERNKLLLRSVMFTVWACWYIQWISRTDTELLYDLSPEPYQSVS
jgi:hypothetical protein